MTVRTHDHELVIDTSTFALNLATDVDGKSLYTVYEDIPNYQNPLVFTQTDWTGGQRQRDYYNPQCYYEGNSINTTQDGRIILGAKINSVGIDGGTLGDSPEFFIWFAAISKLMVATGNTIFWYDGTYFVSKKVFTDKTITGIAVVNDILYVCLGNSDKYYYTTDGANYTQTDLVDGYAQKIIAAPNPAGTATVLWKYTTPNQLSNTTDGRTVAAGGVAWSTPAYIGDTSYDITNLGLHNDKLLIGKEDNLYWYDSAGGTHSMMNDLNRNISALNFKYWSYWKANTYFSLVKDVRELAGQAVSSVSPTKEASDIGLTGYCSGISGDKNFLYISEDVIGSQFPYTFPFNFSTTTDRTVTIYRGKEVTLSDSSGNMYYRWAWCPWIGVGINECNTLFVCQHSDTDLRLWFGYGNNAGYVNIDENPTASDASSTFASTGWIRLSYTYGTDPYWDKMFQSVVLETKGCDANRTVTAKYRKDTDTVATAITSALTSNGVTRAYMTSALSCKRVQFEIHLATNDATKTPEVLYFQAKGLEKPSTVRVHEATYLLGQTPSSKAETTRDLLRLGRSTTNLIKFADLRYGQSTVGTTTGDYVWCVIDPGYPREVEVIREKGRPPELGIQVKFREIDYPIS